jgi:metal-responsive CopG/Arc/MetJ family transcriptional regulator
VKDTRLIALIEPNQMRRLRAAAKREKVSSAEIVRRAIDKYLEQEQHPEKEKARAANAR